MTEKNRGTFCARTEAGLLNCVLNGKGVGKQYMDRDYFVISGIRNKIEKNHEMQIKIRGIAAAAVVAFFLWGLLEPMKSTMISFGLFLIPGILSLFYLDVICTRKNEEYEYEIYRLEVEKLERKKDIAKIRGEVLTEKEEKQYVKPPAKKILPIYYYVVLLILDLLILLLTFR